MTDIRVEKDKYIVITDSSSGDNISSGLTRISARIETLHTVDVYEDYGPIPSSKLSVLPPEPIGTELGEFIPFNRLFRYVDVSSEDRQVVSIQGHYRVQFTPEETPSLFNFIGDGSGNWIDQEWVEVGWIRKYNGDDWEAVLAHTTQTGWEPPVATTLWKLYEAPGPECEEWVQPTGGHDAYNIGDCAIYGGISYLSTVDANVYAPLVVAGQWEVKP